MLLECSASRSANMNFTVVESNCRQTLSQIFRVGNQRRGVLRSGKRPENIRCCVTHIGANGVCTFSNIKIKRLESFVNLNFDNQAVCILAFDSHPINSGSLSVLTRPLRAISAHAKDAPCQVLSAIAGKS